MKNERVEFGDNPSIFRIEEKCTHCGMCKKTCDSIHDIGEECIKCGQCVLTCPMGALVPKYDYQTVLNYLNDTEYTVIVSIAPASRASLIDELDLDKDYPTESLVSVLRQIGFDYVFDIAVGADLTTIEESLELIERIKNKNFPLMTSCCPSWKKYAHIANLDKYVSSTKSPIKMQGYLVGQYLKKYLNFDKKVIHVLLMPCVSKKEEIIGVDGIDYVITTREFMYMINESNKQINSHKLSEFDDLIGNATSSGIIFGTSGGVLEAIIRNTYYLMNNSALPTNKMNRSLDVSKNFDEFTCDLEKIKLNVCRVCGMKELKNIDITKYHVIEVMACPGGCINGGGQPLVVNNQLDEAKEKRSNVLIVINNKKMKKSSYESSEINDVYKYDIGIPGGKNAHNKLHN